TDVGYVLQGVHRTLDCRSCHQAGNYFIDSQCSSCHLSDYRRAMGPDRWHRFDLNNQANPNGPFFIIGSSGNRDGDGNLINNVSTDCGRCHNQFAWGLGASFVPN
ncbi:MAG: hypothetical protein AAFN74_19375, partial [Myxococcota bacterium]